MPPQPTHFVPTPDLRQMGWETRFTIEKVVRKQSLAEHSYLVTMMADLLAQHIGWQGDYGELLREGLRHDLEELVTGDIPTPVKKAFKRIPEAWAEFQKWVAGQMTLKLAWYNREADFREPISRQEILYLVSIADTLEALCYLLEEFAIGNTLVTGVLNYLNSLLFAKIEEIPESLAQQKPLVLSFAIETLAAAKKPNITVK